MSRIEYIKYALQAGAIGPDIIPLAEEFEKFVRGGPPVVANYLFVPVPFGAGEDAVKVDCLYLEEGNIICDGNGAFWRVSKAKQAAE